jgi:hypothetical protein
MHLDYLLKGIRVKIVLKNFNSDTCPWKNTFYDELLKKYTEEDIDLTGLYY